MNVAAENTHLSRIVTTSWDDGSPEDLRVAEMLHARNLSGTFYVPLKGYQGKPTLCHADLKSLSALGLEIGAHSVSHKTLRNLRTEELDREVSVCKHKLQECLGHEITMFCYPNGYYDRRVVEAVKRAGYAGARTRRMFSIDGKMSSFEMPTTIQAFPHSQFRYLRNVGRARNFPVIWRYVTQWSLCKNWVELGKYTFNAMAEHGGVWHLYGHSWEIEELQLWRGLEDILDHVARRANVTYVTNRVLPRILNGSVNYSKPRRCEPAR